MSDFNLEYWVCHHLIDFVTVCGSTRMLPCLIP